MKFMVCYDSSDLSQYVIKEAQKHARLWNADIEIVQVLKRDTAVEYRKLLAMEEKLGEDIRPLFKGSGISFTYQLLVDDLDEGGRVIELAERKGTDLIFIAPRKRSKVGKMLFGSNAQKIILNAPCPVVSITRLAMDSPG